MDKQIKELWLQALRQGRFKQGRDRLRGFPDADSFDAFGVLCEVCRESGLGGEWRDAGDALGWYFVYNDRQSAIFLPDSLAEKISLSIEVEDAVLEIMDLDRSSTDEEKMAKIIQYIEGVA